MSQDHLSKDPPKVLGDDEQFHATDDPIDLSKTPLEGWVALGLFWLLGATVLYQFVTRYVFNDSAAWTEELARYLLIGTVFVGAAVSVAKNNHIQVDFFYRYLPERVGRVVSLGVDVLRILLFLALFLLTVQLMQKMGDYAMTVIDLPMNVVYATCAFGFAAMTWRAVRLLVLHFRRGYSVLQRPETAFEADGTSDTTAA